jgi:hypothetical protein
LAAIRAKSEAKTDDPPADCTHARLYKVFEQGIDGTGLANHSRFEDGKP